MEVGTGGRTKYNRSIRKLPKTHWLDAACVGASTPESLKVKEICPLVITAMGHGSRQICSLRSPTTSSYGRMDKYGFPRTSAKKFKRVRGFQTGDIVKAVVPTGTKAGTYIGRVSVRTSGSFNIKTATGRFVTCRRRFITNHNHDNHSSTVQGISYRHCKMLHHADGYSYVVP